MNWMSWDHLTDAQKKAGRIFVLMTLLVIGLPLALFVGWVGAVHRCLRSGRYMIRRTTIKLAKT